MDRRNFIIGGAASATALVGGNAVAADAYPAHAITFVNPFPPGGIADVTARPLAAALEPVVKQPVVIETKAGAAGAVGAQFVAGAKPDGYTLLVHITSLAGLPEIDKLFGRTPKFTRADYIPIARLVADPVVLVVNPDLPYKTLQDFIADAKKRPDQIIFSSSGLYGGSHIPTALFAQSYGGLQFRHLPTTGGGPAITAVLGNNAQFFMSPTTIALSQIRAGKLRALAVSGATRMKSMPDVPTFKELGPDLDYSFWVGLFAPKGTPDAVITALRAAVDTAAHSPQFKAALANLGQDLAYMDQSEFAKFWDADSERIERAIRSIGRVQG